MEDKRDEKLKAIVAKYESKDVDDTSLTQCPTCNTTIDTEYFEYCGYCLVINGPEATPKLNGIIKHV